MGNVASLAPTHTSVYTSERNIRLPQIDIPKRVAPNRRLKMDGLRLLQQLPEGSTAVAFFDPQYRGVLDKLSYGNEGQQRGQQRAALKQMNESLITAFIKGIYYVLMPTGHLFLWMDKYHLCTGFLYWLKDTELEIVDMITWHKQRIGMGYRTRRTSEHLVVLQKPPKRAKGVWKLHNIPDIWEEKTKRNGHTHAKPIQLQAALIEAVSNVGDIVLDPAAGSFSVLSACKQTQRTFIGCDING